MKATELVPDDLENLIEKQPELARAYRRLGNTKEAKNALAEALKLNAQFPGAEEAKQVLAELEP